MYQLFLPCGTYKCAFRMVRIWQLRMCFFKNTQPRFEDDDSSYSGFHIVISNACWHKTHGVLTHVKLTQDTRSFFMRTFWKRQIWTEFELNLKSRDKKPIITLNCSIKKKQLEKTVNTRKMRRIWKMAKMAILLTLFKQWSVCVEELSTVNCPAEIWCSQSKYLPEKQSFEGKYASFKNIIVLIVHHLIFVHR